MFGTLQTPSGAHRPGIVDHVHDHYLRAFVLTHADDLRHAAHLLGSVAGLALADRVVRDMLESGIITATRRRRLEQLRALLCLDRVQVPGSVEARCFARIDPLDPVVYALCRLADGFEAALDTRLCPAPSGCASTDPADAA